MSRTADTKEGYVAGFETLAARNAVPSWIPPLRFAALSRFRELGYPTRHDEEWRFTPVGPIVDVPFKLCPRGAVRISIQDVEPHRFLSPLPELAEGRTRELPAQAVRGEGLFAAELVFVNGAFAPKLSTQGALPAGVRIASLAELLRAAPSEVEPNLARHADFERSVFTALNTAFLEDGAFVRVAEGVTLEQPVHLLYLSAEHEGPTVSHPRTLIVAGENSRLAVVESYASAKPGQTFANAVTEVVVARGATVDHVKLQREAPTACHIGSMFVTMAENSVFTSHSIAFGAAVARNEVYARLMGEHCECTLNGLFLGDGKRVVDNHTAIDHAMPNCASHELYKGILDGQSHGVFNGKIMVRQDAQKTDAKQTNKTLLLSDAATIDTKPQLEIFADDVKCTHGATVGQLDAEALFYLRARGIGLADARAILIHAFAGDVIQRIKLDALRERLDRELLERLPRTTVEL
jgi:Fe-S cluster assembly protein SufD